MFLVLFIEMVAASAATAISPLAAEEHSRNNYLVVEQSIGRNALASNEESRASPADIQSAEDKFASHSATLSEVASEGPTASIADFEILVGEDGEGELEYLNYGSDHRSTIPVRMVIREPSGRSIRYGFLYPGEENKNASDRIQISRDGPQINGKDIVARFRNVADQLVLVTESEDRDDNRPSILRRTYQIGANIFASRTDVQFEGGVFFNRNEYRLSRLHRGRSQQ